MNEEELKKHLRSGLQSPSDNFTNAIMQRIEEEETALSGVLKPNIQVETSLDFTAAVMQKVEKKASSRVIHPLFVVAILAAFACILIVAISTGTDSAEGPSWSLPNFELGASKIGERYRSFLYLGAVALAISFFSLVEHLYRRRTS